MCLGRRLEERDLQHALAHSAVSPDELVQAAVLKQPASVLVDVDSMRRAWIRPVREHAEGNRLSRTGCQHHVRVTRVEPEGDAPASQRKYDVLAPDNPLAGESPVVQGQSPGNLVRRGARRMRPRGGTRSWDHLRS